MHPLLKNKYFLTALTAIVLGALLYAGKQYLAARELAQLNAQRIEGGWYQRPLAHEGKWYLVPPAEIHSSGIEVGDIPALTNPQTTTVDAADEVIADDLGGVAVEVNGEHRFYPVQIMNWHEVVHDTLGGESILVYYGPLTGAATVYAVPEDMRFVVSGREYNNDVFLQQEGTDILWSGILGAPVVAEREDAFSTTLTRLPSSFVSWATWRDAHPTGTVLSTDTGHVRDYTRHPYGNYENSPGMYFPVNRVTYPVRPKEPAYVVQHESGSVVFVRTAVVLDETPSAMLGDACVVGFSDSSAMYVTVFFCALEDRVLTFTRLEPGVFTDAETGSRWNAQGRAVSGELAGKQLSPMPTVRLYSFAADALFPAAEIVAREFIFEDDEPVAFPEGDVPLVEGENVEGAVVEVVK